LRLLVFKFFYYLNSVRTLRKSLMAWQQRQRAIRETGAGTTAA
jgi:hypothetical protein